MVVLLARVASLFNHLQSLLAKVQTLQSQIDMQYDAAEDMMDVLSGTLNKDLATYEIQALKAITDQGKNPFSNPNNDLYVEKAVKKKIQIESQIENIQKRINKKQNDLLNTNRELASFNSAEKMVENSSELLQQNIKSNGQILHSSKEQNSIKQIR